MATDLRPHPTAVLQERMRALDRPVPPHPNDEAADRRTLGERVADAIAAGAGSWTFILLFMATLASWIVLNLSRGEGAFDPFPFILLNLVLSCVAAMQAPIIMMSQNRQAARDRLHADLDYQVNVRAELELVQMRADLDQLRKDQWDALIRMQEQQLEILRALGEPNRPA